MRIKSEDLYPVYVEAAPSERAVTVDLTPLEAQQVREAWAAWEAAQALLHERYTAGGGFTKHRQRRA